MSDLRRAFDELTSANPVDRDQLESYDSPTARRILRSILNTPQETARRARTPFGKRRLVLVAAIIVVTLITLAAVWIMTRPVTQPQAIACFQAPHPDADRVGIQSGRPAGTAACEQFWADGTLSNPEFGSPGSVPPLMACVSEAGSLFVFPSDDPGLCARLGLAVPDPATSLEADTVRALNNALVDYFSSQPCTTIPQAVADVRRILDEHEAFDWIVVATAGNDERPCASFGLDAEEHTIHLVPIPEPSP